MPVYFITVHTYRSWREDNPHGYIQRGKAGVQKPNAKLAAYRQDSASADAVMFTDPQITLILEAIQEICMNLGVTPYAASCTPTHWHLLAGSIQETGKDNTPAITPQSLATRLKRVIGGKLSAGLGKTGQRWFSRGWHIEAVERQEHFDYLIESYLPKHVIEGGRFVCWKPG